jgi:hypothetical protein
MGNFYSKKMTKIVIVAFFLACFVCVFSASGQAMGDVNGNGSVDIVDSLLVAQYYVGLNPNNFQSAYADVNGSGGIDIIDSLLIAQFYVGLISQFPNGATAVPTAVPTAGPTSSATITLNGSSISVSGTGATVSGTTVTITAGGAYTVSGSLGDGQIAINSADENDVIINLNGMNITNSRTSPIYVIKAKNTELVLVSGTTNYVTDAANYVFPDATTNEPNSAIYAADDLKISGAGTLIVKGNYNDGINTKNDLTIKKTTGTLNITAVDDGIRGKNSIAIKGGNITVNAGGDGLKSDETEDTTLGYIAIEAGTLNITAGGDGMAAETTVNITGGTFTIKSGGGSGATLAADASAKAIKGTVGVTIAGGTFTLDCADDGIHSDNAVNITSGTISISTGDDGLHGDLTLTIDGGTINVIKSYEGLEASTITINNGEIHITSNDDGVNAAGGTSGNNYLYINGGYLYVNVTGTQSGAGTTGGDGVDCNGSITMTGGTVISNGGLGVDAALDYDRTFTMKGGMFVGLGTSQMAQAPGGTSSSQNALRYNFTNRVANTLVNIQNASGASILTCVSNKSFGSVAFSSPNLVTGTTYKIYFGGSASGTLKDGVYTGGSYTPGELAQTFTVSNLVTNLGTTGGF